jgi:hypothetical protein
MRQQRPSRRGHRIRCIYHPESSRPSPRSSDQQRDRHRGRNPLFQPLKRQKSCHPSPSRQHTYLPSSGSGNRLSLSTQCILLLRSHLGAGRGARRSCLLQPPRSTEDRRVPRMMAYQVKILLHCRSQCMVGRMQRGLHAQGHHCLRTGRVGIVAAAGRRRQLKQGDRREGKRHHGISLLGCENQHSLIGKFGGCIFLFVYRVETESIETGNRKKIPAESSCGSHQNESETWKTISQ